MTTGITKTLDDQNKKPAANEKTASFAWGGEGGRSEPHWKVFKPAEGRFETFV